uniref:NADH-ubiquinone oxidoreductase chain 6 n=1 Tax=Coleoptera sp. 8 KM-2017 TaxID=2219342 RepID=A0A346RGG1_9COLE|nr:NADH dehydrogenase subunit 6 [Coleoptera sp. 8 KM-2017]
MLSLIVTINIIMSILFISLKHPLSMGMILLIQTLMTSLMTGNMNQNFWFSYILFLIMIGGMLILFMYMTSIASNEKFKMNLKMMLFTFLIPAMIFIFMPLTKTNINNSETNTLEEITETYSMLNKFMNFPLMTVMLFMMIYLLIALIATVKITSFKQGSIRQMN